MMSSDPGSKGLQAAMQQIMREEVVSKNKSPADCARVLEKRIPDSKWGSNVAQKKSGSREQKKKQKRLGNI